ncbi:MAG: hypothetical protein EA420_03160 [Candidatus Competibacteraceae bacterium]|nr:MAG: hypothetical protein EA420_03160 [Candidatus Competibacteraceae bacterium]
MWQALALRLLLAAIRRLIGGYVYAQIADLVKHAEYRNLDGESKRNYVLRRARDEVTDVAPKLVALALEIAVLHLDPPS